MTGVMASNEQISGEQIGDGQVGDALSETEQSPLEQRAARYRQLVDRLVERLEPPAAS